MTARLCWNCKYFQATDPESALDGICKRHAPKNRDFQSFNIADQLSFMMEAGDVGGALVSGGVLPLIKTGINGQPPTCHATNATGLDANDIVPIATPLFSCGPVYIRVNASRMNSGAGTVGAEPTLKVQCVGVSGTGQSDQWEVDVPCNGVQPNGTGTDSFAYGYAEINPVSPSTLQFARLTGFRVDLSGTTENDVAEVRNLMIGVEGTNHAGNLSLTPPTSAAKWGQISDGSTQFCGEFAKNHETIPAIPVI